MTSDVNYVSFYYPMTEVKLKQIKLRYVVNIYFILGASNHTSNWTDVINNLIAEGGDIALLSVRIEFGLLD